MTERQRLHSLVDELAEAMKKKLDEQRLTGWGGWEDWFREGNKYEAQLADRLARQISKTVIDPVDVANFCAFLHCARRADGESRHEAES